MPATQTKSNPAARVIPTRSGLVVNGARLGELRRAVVVAEIYAHAAAQPKLGRQALVNTVFLARMREPGISERSLWRWLAAFERGGLAALVDRKRGRSGRKPEGKA
jgi:hypothetical protein